MKIKKAFCLSLTFLALVSCQGNTTSSNTSSNSNSTVSTTTENVTVSTKNSKFYMGDLTQYFDITTYFFSDASSIPYVGIEDYFINGMNKFIDPSKSDMGYTLQGTSIINKHTNETLDFDVENNTISSNDFDQFSSASSNLKDPINILTMDIEPIGKYSDKTTYTKGNKVTFNLSKYGVKLKNYQGKIYVPFSFIETIIDGSSPMRFVFNGEDYYLYQGVDRLKNDLGSYTDYATSLLNGSVFKKNGVTKEYATYMYNSFLFTMENFNGHFSRLNISSLDSKLEQDGLKEKICSTDPEIADAAIAEAVNKYFGDGGHTAFVSRGFGCEYNADKDSELRSGMLDYDDRIRESNENNKALIALRGKETLTNNLVMEGETAIISFDSFTAISDTDYTKEKALKDKTSTFGIIYNSFETIKTNSSIKNVVFDVTLNGGGAAQALGEALSFMTDDPVEINVKNYISGGKTTAAIKYDNNLDGDYDDNDSYAGKYTFYIMTSISSFSCGNEFPVIAQEYGYAKVIGQKSGGGDCTTVTYITPDATTWAMSSYYGFVSKNKDIDFDAGATPDYTLDNSYFYDAKKLNSYLSSLTK